MAYRRDHQEVWTLLVPHYSLEAHTACLHEQILPLPNFERFIECNTGADHSLFAYLQAFLQIVPAIQNGVYNDWELMESIWHHAFRYMKGKLHIVLCLINAMPAPSLIYENQLSPIMILLVLQHLLSFINLAHA